MPIIYKITNIKNSKFYIGQTIGSTRSRMRGHLLAAKRGANTILHKAIRKYGKEAFRIEILEEVDRDRLDEREIALIAALQPQYNIAKGGAGSACLGWYWITNGVEDRRHYAPDEVPVGFRKGRNTALINRLHEGKRIGVVSQETRALMSLVRTGKKFSDETRTKMREAAKRREALKRQSLQ